MGRKHVICLIACCLLLSSCLGWLWEEPSIVVREVHVQPLSLKEIHLQLGLDVRNPNRFDLTIASLEYTVYLNQEKIGNGVLAREVLIPKMTTTRVRVPVEAQFLDWNKCLKTVMTARGMPYQIEGKAMVKTLFGHLEFPFSKSGQMSP